MSEEDTRNFSEQERIVDPEIAEDDYQNSSLRPQNLEEFLSLIHI